MMACYTYMKINGSLNINAAKQNLNFNDTKMWNYWFVNQFKHLIRFTPKNGGAYLNVRYFQFIT